MRLVIAGYQGTILPTCYTKVDYMKRSYIRDFALNSRSVRVKREDDRVNQMPVHQQRVTTRCICCGSEELLSSPAILMPFVADRALGWAPVIIDDSWGLKTIRSGNAYSICKTLRCRECEHLFCDIRFTDVEMNALYAGYRGEEYTSLRDHYEPGYRARNNALIETISYKSEIEAFLEPHIDDPLTILDWGGDTGLNTPFEKRRVSLDVFDISGKTTEAGVRAVTAEQATQSKYSLIICGQVLEHIPYPSDVLFSIQPAMDSNTILYVEVPFEEIMRGDIPDREKSKRHWHEHVNFYSRSSLTALLIRCGFTVLESNVFATDVAGSEVQVLQAACRLS